LVEVSCSSGGFLNIESKLFLPLVESAYFCSIIAAAVTFIMGRNVGKGRYVGKKIQAVLSHKAYCGRGGSAASPAVDCTGASKGLFLGLLFLVGGIVIIIIFMVVKDDEDFPAETVFWLTTGLLATVRSILVMHGSFRSSRLCNYSLPQ